MRTNHHQPKRLEKDGDMKVRFWCDSNANINSRKCKIVDLEKEYNITDEQWESYTDEEKEETAEEWAMDNFSFGVEEIKSK